MTHCTNPTRITLLVLSAYPYIGNILVLSVFLFVLVIVFTFCIIWNTFFPTSNWDTETEKGTQTVNAIVLVELNSIGVDAKLDDTSEDCRWINLDPEDAEKNGEDKYVLQGLLRLNSWNPSYIK